MRRLLVPLAAFTILFAVAAPASAAPKPKPPATTPSTYSYSAPGGYKVTVAFEPCGQDTWRVDASGNTIEYHDPIMQYSARVKKGGGMTFEVWAHSPRRINEVLNEAYGFGLSADAVTSLEQNAVSFACLV